MHRRQFLGVLSLGALASLTGGVSAHNVGLDADEFTAVPTWTGTAAARPAADSDHLTGLAGRVVYIATDTGAISYIDEPGGSWTTLPTHLPSYTTAAAPTDFPNGTVIFDSNRNTPAWWDTDHYEYPVFVDDVLTSPVTVANDATRTVIWEPDINANSLQTGRIYQIDLHGIFSTANTSDQFTVDVNIGGTNAAELQNAGQNATDAPWTLEITFTVRQDGQNGTIKPNTRATFDEQPRTARHDAISVDTTTATNLAVAIQWSTADPDNTATLEQAHLKQMG